jgi:membrane protein
VRHLLTSSRLLPALRGARRRGKELNLGLLAAGVAFWGTLSLFPAMIALVMVYGLVRSPQEATRQLDSALSSLSPDLRTLVGDQVASVAATRASALSLGLVLALLVLLWSASTGVQNLMTALTTAVEREETRGFVRLRITSLGLALGAIVLGAALIAAVGVVPALLQHVLGSPALRWVLLGVEAVLVLLVLVAVLAALYRLAPAGDGGHQGHLGRGHRAVRPSTGAVLAAVVLALFTAAFAAYVNLVGSYSKTYGALAGVIVLMLWLYYSTYVVLLGALLDVEQSRGGDPGIRSSAAQDPREPRSAPPPAPARAPR